MKKLRHPKQKIIATAIKLLVKEGVHSVTATKIAEDLAIATSNVFYHFPKQSMIIDGIVPSITSNNSQIVEQYFAKQQPKTVRDQLLAHGVGNLVWAQKCTYEVGALLFGIIESKSNKTLKKQVSMALSVGEQKVYQLICQGIAEGEFKTYDPPTHAAKAIHQALIGLIVDCYTFSRTTQSLESQFALFLDRIID